MSYADLDDFIDAVTLDIAVEVTNLSDADTNSVDIDVFDRAQRKTTAVIDAHLSSAGYTLPLSTTPDLLKGIQVDLDYCELARHGGDEEIRKRKEDAMRLLRDIRDGKLDLGLPTASAPAPVGGPSCSAPARVFSSESLMGF